eukprot:TRINITY_DN29982_c0_g1_i1.p1 TRINITY_DN29982_c0_g1~~TRINITY_DN29982_c0_g1_i1.p1  ORF type:complete len:437 (+),score=100.23 TRINITY_DN29982_c0_g1_i1:69-1379(+)
MVRLCGDAWAPDEGIEVQIPMDLPIRDARDALADALQLPSNRDVFQYHMWSVAEPENFDDVDDPLDLTKTKKLSIYGSLTSQGQKQNSIIYFTKEVLSPKVDATKLTGPLSAVGPTSGDELAPLPVSRSVYFGQPRGHTGCGDESPAHSKTQSWVDAQSFGGREQGSVPSSSLRAKSVPTATRLEAAIAEREDKEKEKPAKADATSRPPLFTVGGSVLNSDAVQRGKGSCDSAGLSSVSTVPSAKACAKPPAPQPRRVSDPSPVGDDTEPPTDAALRAPAPKTAPSPNTPAPAPRSRRVVALEEDEATTGVPPSTSSTPKLSVPARQSTYDWRTVITAEIQPVGFRGTSEASSICHDAEELELDFVPHPRLLSEPRAEAPKSSSLGPSSFTAKKGEPEAVPPASTLPSSVGDVPPFTRPLNGQEVNCALCTTCLIL